MSYLREITEAGIAAYGRMVEDGHGIGAAPKADRDAICAYDDTFGLESEGGALLALLDVAFFARRAAASGDEHHMRDLDGALERLHETEACLRGRLMPAGR